MTNQHPLAETLELPGKTTLPERKQKVIHIFPSVICDKYHTWKNYNKVWGFFSHYNQVRKLAV